MTKKHNGNERKKISLALQGGGAQGAYTWGVLDRLLEEERIDIEAISGTSAGAVTAATLICGYAKGGREGARANMAHFWKRTSEYGLFSPLRQTPLNRLTEGWNLDYSYFYTMFNIATHLFSPKQRNPFNFNPLKSLFKETIDFDTLRTQTEIKLFTAATCVQTGLQHIFTCEKLDLDMLLATSAMPFLFHPVKVGDHHFWDGGYGGNPALWPLIYNAKSSDIMLVQINPFLREQIPEAGNEITNRLNEITFNCSLLGEMRSVRFISEMIRNEKLSDYKDLYMHMIESPGVMHNLNASSKINVDWEFFVYLRDLGRAMMDKWLDENYDALGTRSSFDLDDVLPKDAAYPKANIRLSA